MIRGVIHIPVLDFERAHNQVRIPGRYSSLNLAFLDPRGLDLQWRTVETLARLYTMDVIIHYPLMGMHRYADRAFKTEAPTKVDVFFGGPEWRAVYDECHAGPDLHTRLLSLYKNSLGKLGYQEIIEEQQAGYVPLIRNTRRNAPLYHLLFASKHPLGHDFWDKVTRRNVYGQGRLL